MNWQGECFSKYTFALLSAALLFMPVKLQAKERLTWSYIPFYPYYYTVDGEVKGVIADRIGETFYRAGISYDSIELPNRRLQKLLLKNKIDFTVVIPSFIPDPDNFYISACPIVTIKLQAYTLPGGKYVRNLADLANTPLILISGYSYGGRRNVIEHSSKYSVSAEVENHEAGIRALLANRGAYLLGYEKAVDAALSKLNEQRVLRYTIESMDAYLYLRKSIPDAERMIRDINNALTETGDEYQPGCIQ